jgi:hypothetical protein
VEADFERASGELTLETWESLAPLGTLADRSARSMLRLEKEIAELKAATVEAPPPKKRSPFNERSKDSARSSTAQAQPVRELWENIKRTAYAFAAA